MHNFDIEESQYSESLDDLGLENDHVLTILMTLTVETESDTYNLHIESFQNMNEVLLEVVWIFFVVYVSGECWKRPNPIAFRSMALCCH